MAQEDGTQWVRCRPHGQGTCFRGVSSGTESESGSGRLVLLADAGPEEPARDITSEFPACAHSALQWLSAHSQVGGSPADGSHRDTAWGQDVQDGYDTSLPLRRCGGEPIRASARLVAGARSERTLLPA